MRIVALDLSLTQTGYAVLSAGFPRLGTLVPPKKVAGMERLAWIRREVAVLTAATDLVVIEGYAYAQVHQAHHMGELGGVIRLFLHDAEVPVVEIGPGVLKKFATGKGNARKEDMLVAAVKRLDYGGSNHNEADAYWLLAAACQALGRPLVDLPKAQLEAIASVKWPELRREVAA